jgi:hypothetical protein
LKTEEDSYEEDDDIPLPNIAYNTYGETDNSIKG